MGLLVVSLEDLKEKLLGFLDGRDDVQDLYQGRVNRNEQNLSIFSTDEDMAETISVWVSKGKYEKLLDVWTQGFPLDWNRFYEKDRPSRISLPSYPFAEDRYWIPEFEKKNPQALASLDLQGRSFPLGTFC